MSSDNYYQARQHLNLSQYAFSIVEADRLGFFVFASRTKMVNAILSAYMERANAAIGSVEERYRKDLEKSLAGVPDCKTKTALIDELVRSHCQELKLQAFSYPKERQFKIQLNEENYAATEHFSENGNKNGQYYHGNLGAFLKAIIEEYARKPYCEREAILLHSMIEVIKNAVKNQLLLLVSLQNGHRFEVRPFGVCVDSGYQYHYLVGFSKEAGSNVEEIPVSFRLSRIRVKGSDARSGELSPSEMSIIKDELCKVGVQFLLQRAETVRIQLTEQGKKNYESQLHLRPAFTDRIQTEDGGWIYEFSCSQQQAEYYFFKFGADAKILAPKELERKFLRKYRSAVGRYEACDDASAVR